MKNAKFRVKPEAVFKERNNGFPEIPRLGFLKRLNICFSLLNS